jgi:hypothetical protein
MLPYRADPHQRGHAPTRAIHHVSLRHFGLSLYTSFNLAPNSVTCLVFHSTVALLPCAGDLTLRTVPDLKKLSHETEMGCRWYGWTEPYFVMNLRLFLSWPVTSGSPLKRGGANR